MNKEKQFRKLLWFYQHDPDVKKLMRLTELAILGELEALSPSTKKALLKYRKRIFDLLVTGNVIMDENP